MAEGQSASRTGTRGRIPQTEEKIPLVVSDLNCDKAAFFAVYCFIKNFISASVSCTANIDTKIEHALVLLTTDILNSRSQARKKSQTSPSCSFQITGVSLTRCDFGDDSADDLDESHTDDISRVTDNETPSLSEDSKDTDEVPQPELSRFKVVKVESVAPFSRGRWTCFDFIDHGKDSGPNPTAEKSLTWGRKMKPSTSMTCVEVHKAPFTPPQEALEKPSASVSCTATIDTKIEHALDVVKNHLTHAVRLEVEELKVKINELVDRISFLEYENDLLRANVAPEVLSGLGNNSQK